MLNVSALVQLLCKCKSVYIRDAKATNCRLKAFFLMRCKGSGSPCCNVNGIDLMTSLSLVVLLDCMDGSKFKMVIKLQ